MQIARIGKPVDRHEWSMTPQTVNAVNLPLQNALNFPAAILQPPFFDPQAPAAVNYGAIGSVIGHEISHTFDAEGSAFDSKGRVRNWWTPEDHAHFEQQAEKLEKQYDAYEPFPGVHVNGKQTIDENIADLGGIAAAYDGYRASLHGAESPAQNGFTGDQQFFIAFGQNWGSKVPRSSAAPPGSDRRAFARAVPRRHRPQLRRLVQGLRRQARRNPLPRARRPHSHLVKLRV